MGPFAGSPLLLSRAARERFFRLVESSFQPCGHSAARHGHVLAKVPQQDGGVFGRGSDESPALRSGGGEGQRTDQKRKVICVWGNNSWRSSAWRSSADGVRSSNSSSSSSDVDDEAVPAHSRGEDAENPAENCLADAVVHHGASKISAM